MLLIVGLGNPSKEYMLNRHNLGFMVVDALANYYKFPAFSKKFKGLFSVLNVEGNSVALLKPETFMNLSGESVILAMNFYKLKPEEIIVIYDDLDLDLGVLRYKINSSSGGHNGIKSIQKHIGNDFHRIKIGIGKSEHIPTNDYVLGNFTKSELTSVKDVIEKITYNFSDLCNLEFTNFINKINQ